MLTQEPRPPSVSLPLLNLPWVENSDEGIEARIRFISTRKVIWLKKTASRRQDLFSLMGEQTDIQRDRVACPSRGQGQGARSSTLPGPSPEISGKGKQSMFLTPT